MYHYYKKYYYCSCGVVILTVSRKKHLLTKKHQKYKQGLTHDMSLTLDF